MHRLPSKSSLIRFRLAAYLMVLGTVMMYGSIAFLIYSFFVSHAPHMILACILIGVAIVIIIAQWIVAARARCPLCLTPSLSKKNCSKNRAARRFLGSYRLRAAVTIIVRNYFRCPYCNEPTVLEVRQRKNHG